MFDTHRKCVKLSCIELGLEVPLTRYNFTFTAHGVGMSSKSLKPDKEEGSKRLKVTDISKH
jgi:hypothetical protein